jgi:hypothetical protein
MTTNRTALRLASIAALLLAPAFAMAQTTGAAPAAPAPNTADAPKKAPKVSSLLVVNSRGAKLEGNTLTLDGVSPNSIVFSDRPVRKAGHVMTSKLIDAWATGGTFSKDPPNASVSVFSKDGSSVEDVVLVLKSPKLDGDRLTFDVKVLEGSIAKSDGPASVFIDTIWFSVGSDGFNYAGQNQTLGGITPAVGSREDTSNFNNGGWSNPAPSSHYVPTQSGENYGYAPPPPQ